MTNAEFYTLKEEIAEQAIALVKDCKYDKTKINDGLWSKLCQMLEEINEYV